MAEDRSYIFGSYRSDIQKIMDDFNAATNGTFKAESRVLVPAEGPYSMDQRGIIVEYTGKIDEFETHFQQHLKELEKFAHKLDKRTSLYQYSFTGEFCNIDKWVDYNDTKVAYNYEI